MEEYGEKIKNSRYFRAFCFVCGDPMRVSKGKLYLRGTRKKRILYCESCSVKDKREGFVAAF